MYWQSEKLLAWGSATEGGYRGVARKGGGGGGRRVTWRAGIWVIERQSKPSTLSRTLSRALNITVTTVIAGQVKHIRTTVEQPYKSFISGVVLAACIMRMY